jgi:demethylmenaquinone methyltransferase/2-methoxy-6-polyprenyl-1,4-benzoquinol methylase
MFARIAQRYDLMNSLMTFGQDARWRRCVVEALDGGPVPDGGMVLDVGTGTGRLADAVRDRRPGRSVIGVDFTVEMLRQAPRDLALTAGDAALLPFADERFDAVVSGFLVRNLADLSGGLAEQMRVLRPGGHLIILETTPGPHGILRPLFTLYFRQFVPLLGKLVSGDSAAYSYLPESTLAFTEPSRLVSLLRDRGLREVRARRLGFGSVVVIVGRKARISSRFPEQEAAQ